MIFKIAQKVWATFVRNLLPKLIKNSPIRSHWLQGFTLFLICNQKDTHVRRRISGQRCIGSEPPGTSESRDKGRPSRRFLGPPRSNRTGSGRPESIWKGLNGGHWCLSITTRHQRSIKSQLSRFRSKWLLGPLDLTLLIKFCPFEQILLVWLFEIRTKHQK